MKETGSIEPFHKLHAHARHDSKFMTLTQSQQFINGDGSDIIILDSGVMPDHIDFTDPDTGESRVQLVNWDYLMDNPDCTYEEWRAQDFTFKEMHELIFSAFNEMTSSLNYRSGSVALNEDGTLQYPTSTANYSRYWYQQQGIGDWRNNLLHRIGVFQASKNKGTPFAYLAEDYDDLTENIPNRSAMRHYINIASGHGTGCGSIAAGRLSSSPKSHIYVWLGSGGNKTPNNNQGFPGKAFTLFHRLKKQSGINRCTIVNKSSGTGNDKTHWEAQMFITASGNPSQKFDYENLPTHFITASIFFTSSTADTTTGGQRYEIRPKYDLGPIIEYMRNNKTCAEYRGDLSNSTASMDHVITEYDKITKFLNDTGHYWNYYRADSAYKRSTPIYSEDSGENSVANWAGENSHPYRKLRWSHNNYAYQVHPDRVIEAGMNYERFSYWQKRATQEGVVIVNSAGNNGHRSRPIEDILATTCADSNIGIDVLDPDFGPYPLRQFKVYYGDDHGNLSGELSGSISYGLVGGEGGYNIVKGTNGKGPNNFYNYNSKVDFDASDDWIRFTVGDLPGDHLYNSDIISAGGLAMTHDIDPHAIPHWYDTADIRPNFYLQTSTGGTSQLQPFANQQLLEDGVDASTPLKLVSNTSDFNSKFNERIMPQFSQLFPTSSLLPYERRNPLSDYGSRVDVWSSAYGHTFAYDSWHQGAQAQDTAPPGYTNEISFGYESDMQTLYHPSHSGIRKHYTFFPEETAFAGHMGSTDLDDGKPLNDETGDIISFKYQIVVPESQYEPEPGFKYAPGRRFYYNTQWTTQGTSHAAPEVTSVLGCLGQVLGLNLNATTAKEYIKKFSYKNSIAALEPGSAGRNFPSRWYNPLLRYGDILTTGNSGYNVSMQFNAQNDRLGSNTDITSVENWRKYIFSRLDRTNSPYALGGAPNLRIHNAFLNKTVEEFLVETKKISNILFTGSINIMHGTYDSVYDTEIEQQRLADNVARYGVVEQPGTQYIPILGTGSLDPGTGSLY